MPRTRIAALGLAITLLLFDAAPGRADSADPDPAWQTAESMHDLTDILNEWLDLHSTYPPRATPTRIRRISPSAEARLSGQAARAGLTPRGYYDPDSLTIYLIEPWSPRDALDVSVLLHELVHHRQQETGHWYCPGAQEPDAYRLQQLWLSDRGLEMKVNRIAIILESGCTPYDFHPD